MSASIISFDLGENWVSLLWKQLKSIRKSRCEELDSINNNILFSDPVELAKLYIEPSCQDVNPADRHDEDFFTAKEPMFRKINEFVGLKKSHPGSNQLFILSDSGMGKTSLLVMLKLLHLTSFWPKKYNCIIEKLGENTLPLLKAEKNKRNTILLLDSLDEDSLSYGCVKERLVEILKASEAFFKVIITCRTQFFPEVQKDPLELPGRVRIDQYVCPSKYLSIFDDGQVEAFLNKRYPKKLFSRKRKRVIAKAKTIIKQMGSLRCRPMLLTYIEDLMNSPKIGLSGSEYSIYHSLVQSWLLREKGKISIDSEQLLKACTQLAFEMQSKRKLRISESELDASIGNYSELNNIKLLDIKGRSLLNKNSDGEYRFAHYSIQEFLVVYYIINYASVSDERSIFPTDFIQQLLKSESFQLKDRLNVDLVNIYQEIEARGKKLQPFKDSLRFHKMEKVKSIMAKTLKPMKDSILSEEDDLDVPTFLRRSLD